MMKNILAALLIFAFGASASAQTIDNLAAGGAVSATDKFPSYQGANPATGPTAAQIKTFMGAATATNDNACATCMGFYVEATGTLSSITTSTPVNITQLALAAGDWDVIGVGIDSPNSATTNINNIVFSLSTTTATHSFTPGDYAAIQYGASGLVPGSGVAITGAIPGRRFSLPSPATVFLVGSSSFTVSTNQMTGFIRARRASH